MNNNNDSWRLKTLLLALLLPTSFQCWATQTELAPDVYFSGHATIGALYYADKDAQYYRLVNQRTADFDRFTYEADSRMGLQLAYRPHAAWGAELQTYTRYGYSRQFETNLFSAAVRFKPGDSWLIRAGVLQLESFYRSDSSHVGYSYLWARPPTEMYSYNVANNFNGLALQKSFNLGMDQFKVNLFGGRLDKTISSHEDDQIDGHNSPLYGIGIEYINFDWSISFGASKFELDQDVLLSRTTNPYLGTELRTSPLTPEEQAFFLSLIADNTDVEYYYLGGTYQQGPWRFEAAASVSQSGLRTMEDAYNGFVSLGYRSGRFTPYVLFSHGHNSEPHSYRVPLPDFFYQLYRSGTDNGAAKQHNLAVGVRFDVTNSASLKFQFDYIKNEDNPTYLWTYESDNWDGNNQLISLVLDVTF